MVFTGWSVSSTNNTERHYITETLLKVALNTININRKSIDWLLFNVKWARFQLYSWRENIYKQWIWYVNRLHWNGTVDGNWNCLSKTMICIGYGWNSLIDHEYVSFVVITIPSFPHSGLVIGFVTRITGLVSSVERKLLTLQEHLSFIPGLVWDSCCQYFVFCVNHLLFVLLTIV